MGYILSLNSAEEFIQVVLSEDKNIIVGIEAKSNRKGVVLVPKIVEKCLRLVELDFKHIEKIAVVAGPGSFTGLRIAISYITGLSLGLNIPMGGINYLELLAQNAFFAVKGDVFAVTSAKINMVNVQGFSGPFPFKPITDPLVLRLEEIHNIVPKDSYVLGSGIRKHLHIFEKYHVLDPIFDRPSFDSIVLVSSQIDYSYNPPAPLYLRASDAEENLENILKKRGLK